MSERELPESSDVAENAPKKTVTSLEAKQGENAKPAVKKPARARPATKNSTTRKKVAVKSIVEKMARQKKPFPSVTLEEALVIPQKIKDFNGGNPWRPVDIAKSIGRSEKTKSFFYLAAGARDYGLTEGTRDTEKISLADIGREFVYAGNQNEEKENLQKAFFNVGIFRDVYAHYKGSTLPELKYLGNTLISEFNLNSEYHEEFHRLFQENCRFIQKYGDFSDESEVQDQDLSRRIGSGGSIITLASPKRQRNLEFLSLYLFLKKVEIGQPVFLAKCLTLSSLLLVSTPDSELKLRGRKVRTSFKQRL